MPMDFDPNMEPMELLVYEDTTLLNQLDQILLDSEKSKDLSHENINEIFRIMHTIKGSAAMMGLNGISTLAHAVEDVFAIIRETPEALVGVAEQIFDLVFQASDFLKSEIESLQNTGEANEDPAEIVTELHALAAALKSGEQPEAAASAAPGAAGAASAPPAKRSAAPKDRTINSGIQIRRNRAVFPAARRKAELSATAR